MAADPLAPVRSALIVVDMQEDFCPPDGSLQVKYGRSVWPIINDLLALPGWAMKIATMDLHPQDHVSFASNHPGTRPFVDEIIIENPDNQDEVQSSKVWPDHCVEDTPGADLIPEIHEQLFDHIVIKGVDKRVESYSGFGPPFRNPPVGMSQLEHILKTGCPDGPITHVYVVGLAFDYCVKYTAIDAAQHGYTTYVIEDACKAVDQSPNGLRETRFEMQKAGADTITMRSDFLNPIREPQNYT